MALAVALVLGLKEGDTAILHFNSNLFIAVWCIWGVNAERNV